MPTTATQTFTVHRTSDARHYGNNISLKRGDYNTRYHDGFCTPAGKLRNKLNAKSCEAWHGSEHEAIQFAHQIPNCVGFTRNGTTGAVYFSTNTAKRKWLSNESKWRHQWSIFDLES